jgi:hypothetical protein
MHIYRLRAVPADAIVARVACFMAATGCFVLPQDRQLSATRAISE